MGNSSYEDALPNLGTASIDIFYSKKTWIEGKATDQLRQVAAMNGVSQVCAFPDLHPGKYGPVGCAVLADRLYPQLIGNDIGCGMSVFAMDLQPRKFRLDKTAAKLAALENSFFDQAKRALGKAGLDPDCHAITLGSIGGGNHFCEIQLVQSTSSDYRNALGGLESQSLALMVHSGSRSFGYEIFSRLPPEAYSGLNPESEAAVNYMRSHDLAVRWASLNRQLIASRVAEALRTDITLVADNPHNLIEVCGDGFLHRKGAAKSDLAVIPLAGSRDAPSFLLKPGADIGHSLYSLAHGSGRKYDRKSMQGRAGRNKTELLQLARNKQGGIVVCNDRQLLIAEAPGAYKDPCQVVDDLEMFGLAEPVAKLQPLVTYKKNTPIFSEEKKERQLRRRDRRRQR